MKQYLDLLRTVRNAPIRRDRTGVGTRGVFGYQMRFDLSEGFPMLTTKKLYWKAIVHELLWFLSGSTNIKYLQDNNVHIWDEWADENGDLGPVYGKQWRHWPGLGEFGNDRQGTIDQIAGVILSIKQTPFGRRHIVTAWNPAEVADMALPPCHCLFQFYVHDGKLSCQLYQRSADVFLGVPFNIASYALLTHMIAKVCGLGVGEFVWTGGDTHLYLNHEAQADIQLSRVAGRLPTLRLSDNVSDIDAFTATDIELINYVAEPNIPAPVAV